MALLEISGSAPFTGYSQSVVWDHTHFKGSLRERESAFRLIHMAIGWPQVLTGSSLRHQLPATWAFPQGCSQEGS